MSDTKATTTAEVATPSAPAAEKPRNIVDRALAVICDIFSPLLPLMTTVGLLKGILAILVAVGALTTENGAYIVLYQIADTYFYFLPAFVAFSAAQRFGVNVFVSVTIGLFTLHPTIVSGITGGTLEMFGFNVPEVSYSSSILPILFGVLVQIWLEKAWKKVMPELVLGLFGPLLSLVILVPLTLYVLGPAGTAVSNAIAGAYEFIYGVSPVVAGALLGAFIQPMVSLGLHWSLIPIAINNIATTGTDTILSLVAPAAFAVMGVSFAVAIRTKDVKLRALALGGGISAVCGETSPSLFGVLVPHRKAMLYTCILGGIGGAVIGLTGGTAKSFAMQSVLTLPIYFGDGFVELVIACFAAMALGFAAVLAFGYTSASDPEEA